MESIRLAVGGMSCEGCARSIVAALKYLEGVDSAQASPDLGEAWVTYDRGRVSPDTLRREIEELGYKVTV